MQIVVRQPSFFIYTYESVFCFFLLVPKYKIGCTLGFVRYQKLHNYDKI